MNLLFLAISQVVGFLSFSSLSDLSQWFIQVPRKVTLTTFKYRKPLAILGIISFLLSILTNRGKTKVPPKFVALNAGIFSGMCLAGFVAPTFMMFRSKHKNARFVSIAEAELHIDDQDEVVVVEVNGDSRAYPHKWIVQPHVAGDKIGGEEVALTYCGLSHLGQAYKSSEDIDLKVMTQLENNLVLYDKNTDQPIQQIYGEFEDGSRSLEPVPTRFMSWAAYKEIYPDGKVFFDPGKNPFDFMIRKMMMHSIGRQYNLPEPEFPTIKHVDERLPAKEQIYGVKIGNETCAYTKDFLKSKDGVYNTELGGKSIVIAYFEKFDLVDAFERSVDGKVLQVKDIDVHGRFGETQLERIPLSSRILWIIWRNFFPETELCHVDEKVSSA